MYIGFGTMYGFYTSPKVPGVCPWRIKRSSYERKEGNGCGFVGNELRATKKEMTTSIAGSG